MDIFGIDIIYLVGAAVIALAVFAALAVMIGTLLVFLFWKTQKVILPQLALLIVGGFEIPIKKFLRIFKIEAESVDITITHLRNMLAADEYAKVPYSQRIIFAPQCLRSPNCPARLGPEGIVCINCGQCGLGMLKIEAEKLGYLFFISPGSSLVKRLTKKYKPRAVLGIGCPLEVKEGTALMGAAGIPAQAVPLQRDGCVDTRVDVSAVIEAMVRGGKAENDPKYRQLALEIAKRWKGSEIPEERKREAQEKYLGNEKISLKILRTGWWK